MFDNPQRPALLLFPGYIPSTSTRGNALLFGHSEKHSGERYLISVSLKLSLFPPITKLNPPLLPLPSSRVAKEIGCSGYLVSVNREELYKFWIWQPKFFVLPSPPATSPSCHLCQRLSITRKKVNSSSPICFMKHWQNAWWKERWKLWIKTWDWWQLQISPGPLSKTPAVGSWPLSFPAWGFSREAGGLQADSRSHTHCPVALPLEIDPLLPHHQSQESTIWSS